MSVYISLNALWVGGQQSTHLGYRVPNSCGGVDDRLEVHWGEIWGILAEVDLKHVTEDRPGKGDTNDSTSETD
jgi:hypothetical protein